MGDRTKAAASVAAALALYSAAASAQPPAALDRFDLAIGGYFADSSTSARLDGAVQGTDFDFEHDLGLDPSHAIGRLRLSFLVFDSQGFEIDAYRLRRHGSRSLDRTVVVDDTTYDVNASVRGDLNLDFASVAYRWWVPAGDNDVWGVGVGGGYYRARGVVQGEATVNDQHAYAKVEDSSDAWAPLLELGWRHAFSDSLRIYADLSGVAKGWGPVTGHIINGALGAEWFPTGHVGVGIEYGAQRLLLKSERAGLRGRLKLDLEGPSVFARVRY
jgi:hypothetical protein